MVRLGLILTFVLAALAVVVFWQFQPTDVDVGTLPAVDRARVNTTPVNVNIAVVSPSVVAPIAEFKSRITKKSFGTHITPATSPVQPERFTGYHTGVDVEYQDVTTDVPVVAFADGVVVRATTVSGYGGVLVIQHTVNGQQLLSLYGHLRVTSLPAVGTKVLAGEQVGVLGTGDSTETDGERRHLHFALIKEWTVTYRGYVASESDLSAWLDPLTLIT